MTRHTKEETRHRLALLLTWFGWLGAVALIIVRIITTDNTGQQPHWIGLIVVLLIGIAIAAGSALGRMRLGQTMIQVFAAGMDRQDNRMDANDSRMDANDSRMDANDSKA